MMTTPSRREPMVARFTALLVPTSNTLPKLLQLDTILSYPCDCFEEFFSVSASTRHSDVLG